MRHPSIRELFDYWNERRGARPAPERDDIEPFAIRRVLADAFLLALNPVKGHPFRLAGTRICALFGREVKGVSFLDLFALHARYEMGDLIDIVAQESVGLIASASELKPPEHASPLELLLLPLAPDGRTDACLLGALAPHASSGWLGSRAARFDAWKVPLPRYRHCTSHPREYSGRKDTPWPRRLRRWPVLIGSPSEAPRWE
jgi:hypothetical protein